MREQKSRINVKRQDDITIVEFTERKILDEVNIAQIGQQFDSLVAETAIPKIIVDFSNVSHMSSSALGMLITLHKRIREKNGQLRLANIQPAIFEIFVITRLNEIFQICKTKEEAMQSIQ